MPIPSEAGRERLGRYRRKKRKVVGRGWSFVNPYPWMSEVEARVHLALEEHNVPFTWRYFDAFDLAPTLQLFMPDYHPEFTLREYKYVIIVLGNYFSQLPGMLDRHALAQAALEEDGWTVALIWEDEIRTDTNTAIFSKLPALRVPSITGPPRTNPFGIKPDYLKYRRMWLSGLNLARRIFMRSKERQKGKPHRESGSRGVPPRRRSRNRLRRYRSWDS